jgi:hypothetical protein
MVGVKNILIIVNNSGPTFSLGLKAVDGLRAQTACGLALCQKSGDARSRISLTQFVFAGPH